MRATDWDPRPSAARGSLPISTPPVQHLPAVHGARFCGCGCEEKKSPQLSEAETPGSSESRPTAEREPPIRLLAILHPAQPGPAETIRFVKSCRVHGGQWEADSTFKRRSGVSQLSRLSQHQKASQLAWRSAQLCFSLRSRSAPADFAVHRRRLLDLLALADAARFRSRAALTNLPALILLCHALLIALSCTRSHTSSPPLLEAELTTVSGANVHPLAASAAELKPAAHSNRSLASLHRRSCCLACWLRPLPACRMKLLLCRRLPCPRTLVGPAALPASDRWRRCVHQLSFHPNGWRPHHQR